MAAKKRIRIMKPSSTWLLLSGIGLAAVACKAHDTTGEPTPSFTREQLMDPQSCKNCHPKAYDAWSGSMHAYASDDPIFRAMNRRGQEQTNGDLGKFCVQCHAPLAVQTQATSDGLNLDSLPPSLHGVTCFFCHSIDSIDDTHDFNNPLHLADDGVMRAAYADPVPNSAHHAAYSNLHDRDKIESSRMCGACHDIVTSGGAHIERTFQEWQASVFAQVGVGTTCGQCHMRQSTNLELAAENSPNVFARRTHDHMFPAVDTALVPFPAVDEQKAAVQTFLDSTLQSALCLQGIPGDQQIIAVLDNVAAGHGFPSGSAQDRRLWAELTAYSGDQIIYQSGNVPAGSPVVSSSDPDLWLVRDCMFDGQGSPVDMFWSAASYDTNQLPAQVTFNRLDPRFYRNHIYKTYPGVGSLSTTPDRITLRMHLETIGLDVVQDLASSGHLDPATVPPVLTVGKDLTWTADTATEHYLDRGFPVSCISTTNLSGQADKVPAKLGCAAPPSTDGGVPDGGTVGDAGGDAADDGDGGDQVSCIGDPRVDTYSANLEKTSVAGMKVKIHTADPAPPANGVNDWLLTITDANGQPIDNAALTVTPFMPDHGHGTSVVPEITPQSGGTYDVNPLYLFMPGVWRVTISVQSNGSTDSVAFFFCIQG
jgi:hypothetical protein